MAELTTEQKIAYARREAEKAKDWSKEAKEQVDKDIRKVNTDVEKLKAGLEQKIDNLEKKLREMTIIEINGVKDMVSQIAKINPTNILYDMEQLREFSYTLRDRIDELDVWLAERLVSEVEKYNITHSTEEMKELFKKCPLKIDTLADMLKMDRAHISRMINHQYGSAIYRHKLFLIMTKATIIQKQENEEFIDEVFNQEVIEQ